MSSLNTLGIGERIRALRGSATQKEFADRLGIGRTSVVRYEAGERTPDAEFIAKANSVLGVDPMWLLMGTGVAPAIKPDEAALLDNYRHASAEGKKAIKATSDALAKPATGKGGKKSA